MYEFCAKMCLRLSLSALRNSMPPIALPIEIVCLEAPSSGHLSTPDNGQPATVSPKDSNLYKKTFPRMQSVFARDLLIQLLVGHIPLHKNLLTSSRLGV